MVICLERGADLHMVQLMPLPLTVSCFSKIQTGFTFLVPDHLSSPGKRAVKRLCVCVLLHPFNGLFPKTTLVSRYQKGKSSLDLNEARDDGVWGCSGISWTISKQSAPRARQITTPAPHHSIFTDRMVFLMPNQQRQSTEDISSR